MPLTLSQYNKLISERITSDIDVLFKEFENIKQVKVKLPNEEQAYWSLTRNRNLWRIPENSSTSYKKGEVLLMPVRAEYYSDNGYLAVIPQPIVMHKDIANILEDYARKIFQDYPIEDSLARREFKVPMLIGRFDVIVDKEGSIQICELDDVCSLWPALPKINPIAETYLRALETQIKLPIYTSELFQYSDGAQAASPLVRKEYARISFYDDEGTERVAYIPRTASLEMAVLQQDGFGWRGSQKNTDRETEYYEGILKKLYLHNEDHWRGDINDEWLLKRRDLRLKDVALSVRAYRDMPGFKEHMDRYGPRSITMAWNRDSKWSLVAEKLAVLATNLEVAIEFGKKWQLVHSGQLLVFKTLYSARTEHTAIFSSKGTKLKGVSSAKQIIRKFEGALSEPIIIQPYKEPDSLAKAGIKFKGTAAENDLPGISTDRKVIRSVDHIGSLNPGERIVAGLESHFAMIFRSFVIFLPDENRLIHIGGMWQATDGRIVHGGAHSIAGPLYIDGLMGHKGSKRNTDLRKAEEMLKSNKHLKNTRPNSKIALAI